MRIAYLVDVHGRFDAVADALGAVGEADVLLIGGGDPSGRRLNDGSRAAKEIVHTPATRPTLRLKNVVCCEALDFHVYASERERLEQGLDKAAAPDAVVSAVRV